MLADRTELRELKPLDPHLLAPEWPLLCWGLTKKKRVFPRDPPPPRLTLR